MFGLPQVDPRYRPMVVSATMLSIGIPLYLMDTASAMDPDLRINYSGCNGMGALALTLGVAGVGAASHHLLTSNDAAVHGEVETVRTTSQQPDSQDALAVKMVGREAAHCTAAKTTEEEDAAAYRSFFVLHEIVMLLQCSVIAYATSQNVCLAWIISGFGQTVFIAVMLRALSHAIGEERGWRFAPSVTVAAFTWIGYRAVVLSCPSSWNEKGQMLCPGYEDLQIVQDAGLIGCAIGPPLCVLNGISIYTYCYGFAGRAGPLFTTV